MNLVHPLRIPASAVARPVADGWLLGSVLVLLAFSMVMVFSVALGTHGGVAGGLSVLFKHLFSIGLGLALAVLAASVPISIWQTLSRFLLPLGAVLLALLLLPGIGREINGSTRWFPVGSLHFQPSELVKVLVVLFLADHFVRNAQAVSSFRVGIVEPALVVSGLGVLLLLEPDLGCTVVILMTTLGMMFLAGTRLTYIGGAVLAAVSVVIVLIGSADYRLERFMSFLDPFADPYDSGFQLVQALIALGSGEWLGVGLGASVQKLFYLPHASNDFLAAVIGEELGLAGIAVLVALYTVILWRAFNIGNRAAGAGKLYAARVAQGIGLLLILQMMFHLAVNLGMVPTKGLTLPLMSSGGSSMLANCFAVGLLFSAERSLPASRSGAR